MAKIGEFKVNNPDQVGFTLTLSADLAWWRKVRKALQQAQRDAARWEDQIVFNEFVIRIDGMVELAESAFLSEEVENSDDPS